MKVKSNFWHENKKYKVGDEFTGKVTDELKVFLEEEIITETKGVIKIAELKKTSNPQPKKTPKRRSSTKTASSKKK